MRGCCNGSDSDLHSDRRGSIPLPRTILMTNDEIAKARADLKARMERLKDLPPPTLEEVRIQFAASAKFAREYDCDDVVKIKKSNYIR